MTLGCSVVMGKIARLVVVGDSILSSFRAVGTYITCGMGNRRVSCFPCSVDRKLRPMCTRLPK